MVTITIPKKEYHKLVEKALRYEYLRQIMKENLFASPPTQNIKEIIRNFRETGKYNQKFLKSLKQGLKRSSSFN